jgi:hypothetical protein
MSAQLRLTLTDEQTAQLDALRGPATRTAYAAWLLARALEEQAQRSSKEAGQ